MDVSESRLMFYCKKYTYSTACCVPLMDTCRSGGAICPGGGSTTEKKATLIF